MQAIKYFPHEPFSLLEELKLFNNPEEEEKTPGILFFMIN